MATKLTAFILMFLIAGTARSQIIIALLFGDKLNTGTLEFGLVVTPSLTNLTNTDGKYGSGINLGLYFNVHPEKKLFVHLELTAKETLGAKNIAPYPTGNDSLDILFSEGSVERKIKGFNVILVGRYLLSQHFFLDAGIQPNLMYKSRDVFTSTINNSELEYSLKIDDHITRLDFGVTGGLFYKFKPDKRSMGMGLRYVYGLSDIDKFHSGTQANSAWMLSITIPVGGASKQKEPN